MIFKKFHSALCIVAATTFMAGCGPDDDATPTNNNKASCADGQLPYNLKNDALGLNLSGCGLDCSASPSVCATGEQCLPSTESGKNACVNLSGGGTTTNTTNTSTGGSTTGTTGTSTTNPTGTTGTSTTGTSTTGTSTTGTTTTGTSTTGTTTTGTSTTGTSTTGTTTTNTTGTSTTGTSTTGTTTTNTNNTPTEVGKACTSPMPLGASADCAAGLVCWPEEVNTQNGAVSTGIAGGACTADCGMDPNVCPADTACTNTPFTNGGNAIRICLETCVNDTDCTFPDQECETYAGSTATFCITQVQLDLTEIAKPCTDMPNTCAGNLTCWPENVPVQGGQTVPSDLPGGYCTAFCSDDPSVCGADGACIPSGFTNGAGSLDICMEKCTTPADCSQAGQACSNFRGSAETVCVPVQQGSGAGAACAATADCGGIAPVCQTAYPGGACESDCAQDSDCVAAMGTDAHCDANGTCRQTCGAGATKTDCRDANYACIDADGDNIQECIPDGNALGFGGACTNTMNPLDQGTCAVGRQCWPESLVLQGGQMRDTGYPGGYCTLSCQDDANCGAGAKCVETGFTNGQGALKICMDPCTNAADCTRPEYSCVDTDGDNALDSCQLNATKEIGESCATSGDCLGATAQCFPEPQFPGGYCTATCDPAAPTACTAGTSCKQVAGINAAPTCLKDCTTNADCRSAEGYECVDTDNVGGPDTCAFVAAKGMGAPGDACTSTADCAGGLRGQCLEETMNAQGMTVFSGGYCIVDCTSGAMPFTCPMGSTCRALSAGANTFNFCLDDCTTTADCRMNEGYTCGGVAMGSCF